MLLENVWSALSEKRWRSANEIKTTSGLDDDALMRAVNFLVRWNFAEVRRTPDLRVKRKRGMYSPVELVKVLRAVNETPQLQTILPNRSFRIAERVACRICGGRSLRVVAANEVECTKCLEKQWYAIESRSPVLEEKSTMNEGPSTLKRLIVQLGHPQYAFTRNIPQPTKFYWFRCGNCKTIGTDYEHGTTRYFTCPKCKT
jgi:hypothetical protein